MIFSFSIGSAGDGSERYTLYVPFAFSPGRELKAIDANSSFDLEDYNFKIEKLNHFFAITIGSFESERDAINFYEKLKAAFFWWSITDQIGISFTQTVSKATIYDSPKPAEGNFEYLKKRGWSEFDGHYDADKVVVRPEHKKLIRFEAGQAQVTISSSIEKIEGKISEALKLGHPENVIADEKLKLAIELYSASFYEYSENTQFVSLVNVLEAITTGNDISSHAYEILIQAMSVLKQNRNQYSKNSEEWKELEHLLSRMGNLKRQSIKKALSEFAVSIVKMNPEIGDPQNIKGQLSTSYDLRSSLLHDGKADKEEIKVALSFLREFVPKLLITLYREKASI